MVRRFAPFLLSLLLGFASIGLVSARTAGGLSWQITLCTGDGVVEVRLDANGTPVLATHHCPDCLNGVALGLPPAQTRLPAPDVFPFPGLPFAALPAVPGLGRLPPKAQGPPVFA